MNDLKRLILSMLLVGWAIAPATATDSTLFMPGIAAVWNDAGTVPRAGLSLKAVATDVNERRIMWSAVELRAFQDFTDGTSQIDLSWPGIFGMIYPGVSLEFADGEIIPWFYGEVDLFYFPFLIATLIIVERPWFVPSVYLGPRFGPSGTGWNTGIRMSLPLPAGGASHG
jgi:hypothetical protein